MQKELRPWSLWLNILDYGAIGLTTYSLVMLVVQLAVTREAFETRHTLLLVAAFVGFAIHVCTSRILVTTHNRNS